MSFFEASTVTNERQELYITARCGACGLNKTCKSPKIPPSGLGRKKILIVSEAASETEDEQGTHFFGESGQLLRKTFERFDIDLDRDCWKTNAIICHPPGGRAPSSDEVDYCRPNVSNAINQFKPNLILPLGASAVRSVIGPLWKENSGPLAQWVGWQIPSVELNSWVCPTYHPSQTVSSGHGKEDKLAGVRKVWFERHLEEALALADKPPYSEIPDYSKQVRILMDPHDVAKWIDEKIAVGGVTAFDYETNMLKPDKANAEIVSCAICWKGRETISYPWSGEAIEATKRYLASDLPKIGANTKFEVRFSRAVAKCDVNNIVWDNLVNSHILDNRGTKESSFSINSVKFQAMVRLGVPDWSSVVKPYFEAENLDGTNKIREIDLRTLLKYNGLDAVYEFFIGVKQREEARR